MDTPLRKISAAALVVTAVSLAIIAYRQHQPTYVQTDKEFLNTHSGQHYQ